MSDTEATSGPSAPEPPAGRPTGDHAVDLLRRQAKQLLNGARGGDPILLNGLRAQLPRFASADDATMREQLTLADVQHALARKSGLPSWRDLTRTMRALDPMHLHAARFLKAIRDEQSQHAKEIIDAHPEVARFSIHTAAAVADVNTVRRMLTGDLSFATRPTLPDGTEPIVYAVAHDIKALMGIEEALAVDTVRLLLDAGASANAAVPLGDNGARIPILCFPCANGQASLARLLLERGARTDDGKSVYHAAQHNHRHCLAVLLEFGANLSERHPQYDNTPLYFLAGHRASNPLSEMCVRGMEWLLSHGADPNVVSHVLPTAPQAHAKEVPLHRIAASGHGEDVVRLLVEHGAQVDTPRADGRTAYVLAVRAGSTSAARALAALGADTSKVATIDCLIGTCARADAADARRIVATNPELLRALDADDLEALSLAISDDRMASVELMIDLGFPLDAEGEWGGTPLHWAAWNGRVGLVRKLVAAGAPINTRDSQYGSSALAWAAHGSVHCTTVRPDDYVAIVNALLDAGATRADAYNRWNESPVSMASPPVARVLRERGFGV